MSDRPLIVVAHGTDDQDGRRTVLDLRDRVRERCPGRVVEAAYVDVQQPDPETVLAQVAPSGAPVLVPLLLSTGFHIEVDIARAVQGCPGAVAAGSLGPDPVLAEVLQDRLSEAGVPQDEPVILAAAGSSRARAAHDAERMARELAGLRAGEVAVAYGSAASPSVAEAVAQAHAEGRRAVVAAYLLGRGVFAGRLAAAGADLVTAPLGADHRLAELVLRRAREAEGTNSPEHG